MRLDLELIEVFCCVYEEGNFSRAASRLLLSQPTVSGHIKNLESYIDAKLFDRLPRQIVPTRAGHLLYKHGRVILDEKKAAIQELMGFLNQVEGSLIISASTIPGEYLLPQFIASFYRQFPGVRIEMQISDSGRVCEDILNGKAEIGFSGARQESITMKYGLFAVDELVVIAPNDDRWRSVESLSLERLSKMPFLARGTGSGTREMFEKKTRCSINDFNVVGYLSSSNAIKEAVKAGLGIAVISNLAVRSEVASGSLKTVSIEDIESISRQFYTVVNRNLTLSPIAGQFLDFVTCSRIEQAISA